ncbi:uncharacterized protein LOC128483495 [Spea bombifrons]|uniref:uncharacterized protein LOC128483495 n=1 Tax=Spea bombifrons TaxID=233779 RepID=UPI00234BF2FD|nr:uncharacterized protein LOC128483495 [Spea bombifrons]
MPKCIVPRCKNRHRKGKTSEEFTLHLFPISEDRIKSWLEAIGLDFGDVEETVQRIRNPKTRNAFRVCSEHFTSESYHLVGVRQCLKPDSIPSIFSRVINSPKVPDCTEVSTSSQSSNGSEIQPSTSFENCLAQAKATAGLVIPPPRKRFMDHDYTDESSPFTFNTCVSEGTNTETPKTSDKSTFTLNYGRRSVSTQTSFFRGKRNCKTSTDRLIIMKDVGTWTGLFEDLLEQTDVLAQKVEFPATSEHSKPTKQKKKKTTVASKKSLHKRPLKRGIRTSSKLGLSRVLKGRNKVIEESESDLDALFESSECEEHSPTYSDFTVEVEADVDELPFVREASPEDIVAQKKFLVFETCLDDLLRNLTRCAHLDSCDAPIIQRHKEITGTVLIVYGTCANYHQSELWRSQPMIGTQAAGNVLSSASILFSGGNYANVAEMFKILGMPFISKSAHLINQKKFLFPVVDLYYKKEQQANIISLKGKALCLSGDGHCDSPGFSAKYYTYSLLEEKTNKIIECQTVQVSEKTSLVAMETKAFRRCMNNLLNHKLKIGIIATDRHTGIQKIMREEYKKIHHEFDIWHYCKSLTKKLTTISKKKSCEVLALWTKSVVNHLWACSSLCKGSVGMLRERWNSLLRHIVNVHQWDDGTLFHACDHPPITENEEKSKAWLSIEGVPYRQMESVILDQKLQEDLEHLSQFCHAGGQEVFHDILMKYRPKGTHLTVDGIVARTQLAVLAHNNTVNKQRDYGEIGGVTRLPYFPKRSQTWQIKALYEENYIDYIYPMLADVIRMASGDLALQWESRSRRLSQNIASMPHP